MSCKCRPDVVLMSWWRIGIMYHGKMQPGKLGLTHPSNASCNFHGYESPIPKIVAACLQKSQDAQARCDIMYDVKLDKNCRSHVVKLSSNVAPVPS